MPLCIGAFRIIICLDNERLLIAFLVHLLFGAASLLCSTFKKMYFNFTAYIFIYIYVCIWYTVDACKITMAAPWMEMCRLRVRKIMVHGGSEIGVAHFFTCLQRKAYQNIFGKLLLFTFSGLVDP